MPQWRPSRSSSARARAGIGVRVLLTGLTLFAVAVAVAAWRDARRSPAPDDPEIEFTVDGLDCPVWCAVRLSEAIDRLDGARVEGIDQKHGKVIVRHDPARQNLAALEALFAARGFPVRATAPVTGR